MNATPAIYDFMIGEWSVEFDLLPPVRLETPIDRETP
jgi:hypothetical protein